MLNYTRTILRRTLLSNLNTISTPIYLNHQNTISISTSSSSSSPSLSIWRRKKELGKEGLIIAKELKRLQSSPLRLDHFIKSHVSRLLKSDLVSVLFEFQRQDLVFLSMKVCFPSLLYVTFLLFLYCIVVFPIIPFHTSGSASFVTFDMTTYKLYAFDMH